MKVKAIAPWFGSKRTLAPVIIQQLGPHRYYFEPFCGSLAVLLAKDQAQHEVVCDLHRDLTNLAVVCQDPDGAVDLFARVSTTLCCEEVFRTAMVAVKQGYDGELGNVDRAVTYFVASWLQMSGVAGTARQGSPNKIGFNMATRWTPNGGPSAKRFRSAVESIPAWHDRLRNVQILNRDGFEILQKISDEPGVAIYCDPPYPPETLSGDARYEHDFVSVSDAQALFQTTDDDPPRCDHAILATELWRFGHARVVVSCYDCDRYRELYDGWAFIDCARSKNLHSHGGRGPRKSVAPEILIVNGAQQ